MTTPPMTDEELVAALVNLGRWLRNVKDLPTSAEIVDQAAARIKALGEEREALHQGLRERGMRLESTPPGQDALNAITEWKGYADKASAERDRFSTRVAELEEGLRPFALDPMDGQRAPIGEVICRDGRRYAVVPKDYARARSLLQGDGTKGSSDG